MATDRLKWKGLVTGAIVAAVVIGVALGVLLFARVGAVRGDTFVLYAAFNDARQIIPNSEVWLLGEKVGAVEEITFLPVAEDTSAHVLLRLNIWERARPFIRSDATLQLRSGGSLLGAPVVYVDGGTPGAPTVTTGDTLFGLARVDQDEVRAEATAGLVDARAVLADLRVVARGIGRTRSTVSSLVGAGGDNGRLTGPVGELMSSIRRIAGSDSGTLRQLVGEGELRGRATSIQARLDSLAVAARTPVGTIGRARADSALARAASALLADAELLRGQAQALSNALAGRDSTAIAAALALSPDSGDAVIPVPTPASRAAAETRAALAGVDSAMAAVIADLKRRPWRYLPF